MCDRLVGTGESFNYSLSVADSLEQIRSGNLPPLVGQTRYAFNGRIHPLRNAPYLTYLAAAVDAASLHRLSFWQVQNLSLCISLVGAVLACYLGLRRGVDCPRGWAFLLSATYGLSPPLLGAAYFEDLYMTVHAAVFVPLAVGACMRSCLRPSFSADAWLAAALALTWLAHPPVALWLTTGALFVRAAVFALRPSWQTLVRGTGAVLVAGLLAAFAFVSVGTLNSDLGLVSGLDLYKGTVPAILQGIRESFPASVLPVGTGSAGRGHLQFGYAAWALLLASAVALVRRAPEPRTGETALTRRVGALALAFSGFLLLHVLPIPGITAYLWHHVPSIVLALTNLWPMQRLYLVAVAFTLFAASLVLPNRLSQGPPRKVIVAGLAALSVWTAFQAGVYVKHGYADRLSLAATQSAFRPSNLDLTVTSYAYYGTPRTFVNGVMDPLFEFRLLRGGTVEVDSQYAAALARSTVVAQTELSGVKPAQVTLNPGRRYLLTFDFRVPPLSGELELDGALLHRTYPLPSAGQGVGFGMTDGERHSIPVWTDSPRPESVTIKITAPGLGETSGVLADVALREVRPSGLPVRLESLYPLRFNVDSADLGSAVETPRSYLSGYVARVNGVVVPPSMSPDRRVMVPVPPGHSEVELTYRGSALLRASFWLTLASWLLFAAIRLAGPRLRMGIGRCIAGFASGLLRIRIYLAVAAVLALAAAAFGRWEARQKAYLAGVGPIEIRFRLPYGKTNFNQPLLRTGHAGAAVVIFARVTDERHVRIGADVWGTLLMSEPVEIDISAPHSLVVSHSALYPLEHPRIRSMNPSEVLLVRKELRLELDGRTVIRTDSTGFETTLSEIEVGRSAIGSLTDRVFSGQILGVARLPIPRYIVVPEGRHVRMTVTFPEGRKGLSEPLLCNTSGDRVRACYITYMGSGRARVTSWGPGGVSPISADISYHPGSSHVLDFICGDANDRSLAFGIRFLFDGAPLMGDQRLHAPDVPVLVVPGCNESKIPGVLDRFTGPQMDTKVVSDAPEKAPFVAAGPVHLIVSFPERKSGRSEPLVSTGHTGKGDVVFVTYVDDQHVTIGHDHWGVGATSSALIPLNYAVPHELWISMRSLSPAEQPMPGPAVAVVLDAKVVLSSDAVPYPSTQKEITVTENRIGASSADPEFSGLVHFAERLGEASP